MDRHGVGDAVGGGGGIARSALLWHLKGAIYASMEKRAPTYDLAGFRQEFVSVRSLRMTRTAQNATMQLGMTLQDVVQVVQSMTHGHFDKSRRATGTIASGRTSTMSRGAHSSST